jgi:glycosyltransferase involved in cell wall biosynthesis
VDKRGKAMNNIPLVSVVMIFFNGEKFIEEAIESVMEQRYKNWELLLVDDGSTDNSTKIAQQYTNKLPHKIHYIEHECHQNKGMSASRNLGISHAKGLYIALLDCDDVWLPQIMKSNPQASMVYGPSQRWYGWTGESEDIQRDSVYNLGEAVHGLIRPPIMLTLLLQNKIITPCPSNVLFRCELIQRAGRFEESWQGMYQLYEDQVFFTKVYLHETVFIASECWDKYRKHPDSCVAIVQKAGLSNTIRLAFLNWQKEYLSSQGIENIEIWQALRRQILACRYPQLYSLKRQFSSIPSILSICRNLIWQK